MNAPNVLVCGNFGFRTGQIDGQTMKTRVFRETLAGIFGRERITELDSSRFLPNIIGFFRKARYGIKHNSQTIILPGRRGLQIFLPIFLFWKRKWNRPIRYVVIGGWLPEILTRKSWLRRLCFQLDGIYVETQSMADRLGGLGLRKVQVIPNFRLFNRYMARHYVPNSRPIKLVFYSRVDRKKGVEDAIAAVQRLNAFADVPLAVLDIYGPIRKDYRKSFEQLLVSSQQVKYKGVLTPEDVYCVLQNYDLMLFPTYYDGEGFPGAIIDAYIAGLPVLASDWKYNCEVITCGKTGSLCQPHSVESIVKEIRNYCATPERLAEMRACCIEEGQKYHAEVALSGLLADIAEDSMIKSL